jgi:nitrite reductase/ring-hydroxylating ferredoxin subunit
MARHVVAAAAGRSIAVFNVDGRYYALRDVCPHRGAPLSAGVVVGTLTARAPGEYDYDASCAHVRCPWHGWEYDLETGQSWYDPKHGGKARAYAIGLESGRELIEGPYLAETIPISVEGEYVVIDIGGRS